MSMFDWNLMAVIKRYGAYYKTSTYVLYSSVCSLTFPHNTANAALLIKNLWHVCCNYRHCVLNVVCVSCDRWIVQLQINLIQYQKNESECSKSGEGSTQNVDKALVPVTYSRGRTSKMIIDKPSVISRRVQWYTIAFIFGVKWRRIVVPLFGNSKFQKIITQKIVP